MRRRDFVILLGGGILVWTQRVSAQQPGELPIIGYIGQGTPAAEAKRVSAFVERLRELSWIERTVLIEYRWTEGRSDLAADIAAEFVRRKVDVIVTAATPLILAAKQVTSAIPIVFSVAGDPVSSGLVTSLARPGGNVTGLSVLSTDLVRKRLGLLRELVPGLRRVAIMGNVGNPVIVHESGNFKQRPVSSPQRSYFRNPATFAIAPLLGDKRTRSRTFPTGGLLRCSNTCILC